ncbi:NAD(P)-dependent alcohol dehydrogenase [Agromyces tropicus]|uniref:NAD(P)-dependent alcohol dehydrogenase n=1 Tax=Agromyces tropicus TaxID=555371 RepID=A0ABP5GCS4_9MICO
MATPEPTSARTVDAVRAVDGGGGATMRAAVADRFGPPEVVRLADVPRPHAAAGEVLVHVRAASVSIADHRVRSRDVPRSLSLLVAPTLGLFRPRVRVAGMDGAGVVESVGEGVEGFAAGDAVMFLRGDAFGSHAEYVTMPADGAIARVPDGWSLEDAAALVFGGATALSFLARARIGAGTEVLVNGASGAVGTAAVQLAAHRGARVTAVTSARNAELVRSLGADRVVDYATEDFAAAGERYDVVVECVGNAPFARVAPLIRPGGALLLVITGLGGMLAAGLRSRRSGVQVTASGVGVGREGMRRLAALAEEGAIRPVIDRTYDLDEIVEAHRYVDTGRKRGAVMLRIG